MTTLSLVGAQWGSEGKGVIAGGLAPMVSAAVRVGGPNAGHSLFHKGVLHKMRSVPCAWVNPNATLIVGAGAVINPGLLQTEIANLEAATERHVFVHVDPYAVLITHDMEAAEADIVKKIGSTGEGVGQARIARIRRDGSALLAMDYDWQHSGVIIQETEILINDMLRDGRTVMLEGTQGSGLSLYHGAYPKVTSDDTNAASLHAEAGIAPSESGHVMLVARTYPIRVAGDSGPMGVEMTWDWFIKRGIVDVAEQTTVTKKTRRIAQWYAPVFEKALRMNRPCGIWITFGDYFAPELRGTIMPDPVVEHDVLGGFIHDMRRRYGVPILGVGTGPGEYPNGEADFMVAHLDECAHGVSWDWNFRANPKAGLITKKDEERFAAR